MCSAKERTKIEADISKKSAKSLIAGLPSDPGLPNGGRRRTPPPIASRAASCPTASVRFRRVSPGGRVSPGRSPFGS